MTLKKILVIQTAFIGDAILATSLLEKLNEYFPESQIDYMIRKGNEGLFANHPFINQLIVWNKNEAKIRSLFKILKETRKAKYDYLINLQRFASTGLFTVLSNAKHKIGFNKNPFSLFFSSSFKHSTEEGSHEIERNHQLISHITDNHFVRPKLYPSELDYVKVKVYKGIEYICISPASVWFTKQFPKEKWLEFISKIDKEIFVYLLGGPGDYELCEVIKNESERVKIDNLAGKLNLIQSAALMDGAIMNYTNDSAPLHLASAMNAPVTAIFCSTSPEFGFGPLSDSSKIIQSRLDLSCKPCGLHGKKACPEKHFNCAKTIDTNELLIFN